MTGAAQQADAAFWAEQHDGGWYIMYQPLRHVPREEWPKPVRLLRYNLDDVEDRVKEHACTAMAAMLDKAHREQPA